MNQVINIKNEKQIYGFFVGCFLVIHICLLVLFWHYRVIPMIFINVLSVCFYIGAVFMIRQEMIRLVMISVYIEIVIHMSLAELFTGWNSGFQITLIGMNILLFFAEYIGRTLRHEYARALPLSIIGSSSYLLILVILHFIPPYYPLPEPVSFWLQIAWGIITLTVATSCLQGFVWLLYHSDDLLRSQAVIDQLTGLPNRYHISQYLKTIEKGDLHQYWVALTDIDDFKCINDSYGHNYGDYVLVTLAQILRDSNLDAELCRWGGEEFLIVGKIGEGMDAQYERLDSFRREVENYTFEYEGEVTHLTITIGVSPYRKEKNIRSWINSADRNLYKGKNSGKNKVVYQIDEHEYAEDAGVYTQGIL